MRTKSERTCRGIREALQKKGSPTAGAVGPGGVGEAGGSAAPTREKLVSGAGGLKAAPLRSHHGLQAARLDRAHP